MQFIIAWPFYTKLISPEPVPVKYNFDSASVKVDTARTTVAKLDSVSEKRVKPADKREVRGEVLAPSNLLWSDAPEKMVTIKKADFEAPCIDSCPICLEKHIKGDTIMTECNHEFGIQCYNSWMTAFTSNHTCPTCRKVTPRVTMYKTRCRKPRPFIIEDEEEPVQEVVGF